MISGAGNGVENVAARDARPRARAAALHGRVFAAYMGLVSSTQIIATALGGALVVGVGGQQALVIGGLGSLAVGLLGLIGLAFVSAAKPAVADERTRRCADRGPPITGLRRHLARPEVAASPAAQQVRARP